MAIESGARFGSYEVVEPIGAGGMGEVWLARDTALNRDVAIKVLPQAFVEDADRLARFQREAEILASLNHANIATIHGLEKIGDQTVIVMELVEGPTLAEQIAKGPIPLDEAMGIAQQIVSALEAAHNKLIVHRDLKPANVKVRTDGTVKVLDFGISKPMDPQTISGTPVMTTPAVTQTGVILGTAAYMSPEQARGRFVDQRTDIWAFGCLLFEMLTGQPAFGGGDVMEVLARVIDRDADLSSMPRTISSAVRQTIALCLRKDPRKRISDIRDVRLALEGEFESHLARADEPRASASVWQRAWPVAAAVLIAAGVTWFAIGIEQDAPAEVRRSVQQIPADHSLLLPVFPLVAVSDDGRQIAYSGANGVFVRNLSQLETRLVTGTDQDFAALPVFSPDGSTIGFGSLLDRGFKAVSVAGGTPLLSSWTGNSGSGGWGWLDNDTFLTDNRNVSEGVQCQIERRSPGEDRGEILFRDSESICSLPRMLPDGEHLLMGRPDPADPDQSVVVVASMVTGETTTLFRGMQPHYIEPGYIVYFDPSAGLMARRFDAGALEAGSRSAALNDDIFMAAWAQFDVSSNGTLVYVRGPRSRSGAASLAVADSRGAVVPLDLPARDFVWVRVSPDNQRIAVEARETDGSHIWIYDLAAASAPYELHFEGSNSRPVWLDNDSIAFTSDVGGTPSIYRKRADGSGSIEQVTQAAEGQQHLAEALAPDGRLAYEVNLGAGQSDVYIVSLEDGESELLIGDDGAQYGVAFSPDGTVMAYTSEIGSIRSRLGVWVDRFPPDGSRRQVSTEGEFSAYPVFSADGRRLAFQSGRSGMGLDGLAEVDFDSRALRWSGLRQLPITIRTGRFELLGSFDVLEDGRFVVVMDSALASGDGLAGREIVIVENFVEEVKAELGSD